MVVPLAALALGLLWWLSGGRWVSTDNAYVGADKALITPNVTGPIVSIHVKEGQKVAAGDPLFDIDPAPYRTALALAQGRLAAAKVDFANLRETFITNIDQIKMGQDAVDLRQADYDRKQALIASRSVTRVEADTSAAALVQAKQILEFVRQQQDAARVKLGGGPDVPIETFPAYIQAKAQVEDAERNLAYASVKAPIAGVATQVAQIELGRVAPAGQPVFAVVADTGLWVDGNPKESDLTYVKVGLPATVTVDTFPDREWRGSICSIAPGTGAQFAILPPQNASGNWVKVVQRIPLRFCFDADQDMTGLRAGMSADVSIDTGRTRSLAGLYESIRRLGRIVVRIRPGARGLCEAVSDSPADTIAPLERSLLTVCVMMATIMQALDTTIANVALPYMQGSLSTTQDQVNWVLTSYIVAAAIMTSPLGWMAMRVRAQEAVHRLHRGFHGRLDAVRNRAEHRADGRLPSVAGRVRRRAGPDQPGGDARHLSPGQARLRDGDLGHGRDARPDHGTDPGRLADGRLHLALGVLRQSAVRHFDGSRPLHLHARKRDPQGCSVLLVRLSDPFARDRRAADDARPRPGPGLVRFQRNHRRGDPLGGRLLFLFRRRVDLGASVHSDPDLSRLEFFDRRHVHVPDRHHPFGDDGAGDALSSRT